MQTLHPNVEPPHLRPFIPIVGAWILVTALAGGMTWFFSLSPWTWWRQSRVAQPFEHGGAGAHRGVESVALTFLHHPSEPQPAYSNECTDERLDLMDRAL